MSIIKFANVNSKSNRSVKQIADYVLRDEACTGFDTMNMDCFVKDANLISEEFSSLKNYHSKNGGRPYYHMIVSFTEGTEPDKVNDFMNDYLKDQFFENKQLFVVYHTRDKNPHAHVIINSVQLDGRKIQISKNDLINLKLEGDRITDRHGIHEVVKYSDILGGSKSRNDDFQAYDKDVYNAVIRGSEGQYKSYVYDISLQVAIAKNQAISQDDFIEILKNNGITTKWVNARKNITFEDSDGHKIRNTRIDKYFNIGVGKEDLYNGFEANKHNREREEKERGREYKRTGISQTENRKREFERESSESSGRKQEFETRFRQLQQENEQLELNRIREEERREREEKERAERHRIAVEKATRQLERTICNNQQPTSRTRQDEEGFSL